MVSSLRVFVRPPSGGVAPAGRARMILNIFSAPLAVSKSVRLSRSLTRKRGSTLVASRATSTMQSTQCSFAAAPTSLHGRRTRAVVAAAGQAQPCHPSVLLQQSLVALASLVVFVAPAGAELNRREAATFGEFNRGSAQQFGSTTMKKVDFVKEYGKDLRLSNFTATDLRFSSLKGADLRGAYFIKAVAPSVDFSGADLTDSLMDRGVYVDADFTGAILARTVLTLSDLTGAKIEGADFSDALLDKLQQQALCKYASGVNPTTGVDTRKSLSCGGRMRGSPSAYMGDGGSAKPEPLFEEGRFSSFENE